jgi:hypothetical protein
MPLHPADPATVPPAAPRSPGPRPLRVVGSIVRGTLVTGGVAAAAGVQWAARRAAAVARRRLEAWAAGDLSDAGGHAGA